MQKHKIKYFLTGLICLMIISGQAAFTYASEVPTHADGTTLPAEEAETYRTPATTAPPATTAAPPETTTTPPETTTTPPETTTKQPTPAAKKKNKATKAAEETTTTASKTEAVLAIIQSIDKLPKIENITLNDKTTIDAIRTEYDKLSQAEKLTVSNYETFLLLETRAETLALEESKKFIYSFEIKDGNPAALLMVTYAGERPDFTFISPEKTEIPLESDNITHRDIDIVVRYTAPVQKDETETAGTIELVPIGSSEEIEVPQTGFNHAPALLDEDDGKENTLYIYIKRALVGVWSVRTNMPVDIEELEYVAPGEEIPTTIAETETETETEIKTETETKKAPRTIIYIIGFIIIIAAAFVIARILLKKKQTNANNKIAHKNEDDFDDIPVIDNETIGKIDKEKSNKKEKPSKKKPSAAKKDSLFKREKPSAKKDSLFKAKNSLDYTSYKKEGDDDEIARLRAEADAMWEKVEPKEENLIKPEVQHDEYEEEKIEYITQEDIDNDITIEEYVDGKQETDTSEIDEKIRKRRSFFPEDRFN